MIAVRHHLLINIHGVSTFHVTAPPHYGVHESVSQLWLRRRCICSNCEYVFRAPKVSKKCIVRANESEQECELRREGNRQS